MPFYSTYTLRGFKQFVADQEQQARHLFHENAHEWVALEVGATKVSRSINFSGTSKVELRGIGSPENYCQVAVAGMLGEAKALKNEISPECEIDLGPRLQNFAQLLFEKIKHWPSDSTSEIGIEPDVPMTCPMASTEWGGLSVADLSRPIANGLTEGQLYNGLVAAAKLFNDVQSWRRFLKYHSANLT